MSKMSSLMDCGEHKNWQNLSNGRLGSSACRGGCRRACGGLCPSDDVSDAAVAEPCVRQVGGFIDDAVATGFAGGGVADDVAAGGEAANDQAVGFGGAEHGAGALAGLE